MHTRMRRRVESMIEVAISFKKPENYLFFVEMDSLYVWQALDRAKPEKPSKIKSPNSRSFKSLVCYYYLFLLN